MVRCGDCQFCQKLKGEDGKKFYACFFEHKDSLNQDNPEFWALFNNPLVLESMVAVNRFDNRRCGNYRKKKE
jgi:hypothetical protein